VFKLQFSYETMQILRAAIPYAIPAFLHALGLLVLLKTPSHELGLSNKLYFVNLSIAEIVLSVTGILHRVLPKDVYSILKVAQYLFGSCVMYQVMIFLTLDRFFRVFLNIKFHLYWSDFRTKILLAVLWMFEGLMFASSFFIGVEHMLYVASFIFPSFDVIFVVVSVFTYTYIFAKIRSNSREQEKIYSSRMKRCRRNDIEPRNPSFANANGGTSKIKSKIRRPMIGKQFLSIFLLVLTFVFFTITADAIQGYHFVFRAKKVSIAMETLTIALYSLSYTADVFIYIFGAKPVRKTLSRMFGPVSRRFVMKTRSCASSETTSEKRSHK